ncbi:hypothetical protein GW17_00041880, partial [Ensete ventricosum]
SYFSQKDVLALSLPPSALLPSLPLRWQSPPLQARRGQSLAGWPLAVATSARCPATCPFTGAVLRAAAALARWPWPPLRAASSAGGRPLQVGLGRGLAVGGRPYMGAGRGWPPLLLAAFAGKIQQEHVERFYAIQSHDT